MNYNDYQFELNTIRHIAESNGFPQDTVDKLIRKEYISHDPLFVSRHKQNNYIYKTFTYNNISAKLGGLLKNYDVKPAFKTNTTLDNLLSNNKDKTDPIKKSGVYRIGCDNCNCIYIGETGRAVETRIQEHRKNNSSNFYQHLLSTGHKSTNNDNVKVIHNYHKSAKLKLLEAYEIEKHKKDNNIILLNEQLQYNKTPLFKYLNPLCTDGTLKSLDVDRAIY